eukprot:364642-Chlamydomonas_euryale.AAC.4
MPAIVCTTCGVGRFFSRAALLGRWRHTSDAPHSSHIRRVTRSYLHREPRASNALQLSRINARHNCNPAQRRHWRHSSTRRPRRYTSRPGRLTRRTQPLPPICFRPVCRVTAPSMRAHLQSSTNMQQQAQRRAAQPARRAPASAPSGASVAAPSQSAAVARATASCRITLHPGRRSISTTALPVTASPSPTARRGDTFLRCTPAAAAPPRRALRRRGCMLVSAAKKGGGGKKGGKKGGGGGSALAGLLQKKAEAEAGSQSQRATSKQYADPEVRSQEYMGGWGGSGMNGQRSPTHWLCAWPIACACTRAAANACAWAAAPANANAWIQAAAMAHACA